MKSPSSICTLAFSAALIAGLSACCKQWLSADLKITFQDDQFSSLDSILVISADDHGQHFDTTFYDLRENLTIHVPVHVHGPQNGSFIIKDAPQTFEHHVTEINTESQKGCGTKPKFSFKFQGKQYKKRKKHSMTIEE